MNEEQAQEVVMLIRAATAARVEDNTLQYFTAALQALDYDLGLAAASIGTITWRKFPSWAEYKEVYRAQKRLAEPVGEQRQDTPKDRQDSGFKRGVGAAEWVHVWMWCRTERQPRNLRAFPQQESHVDPGDIMTNDEYEKVRDEWKEAGSPKYEKPIPMAR